MKRLLIFILLIISITSNSQVVRNWLIQKQVKIIPTYLFIGDSNCEGLATIAGSTSPYLYNLISGSGNSSKKIFDFKSTNTFINMNIDNSMALTSGNYGLEQSLMIELKKFHNSEVRIIKYGKTGSLAGPLTGTNSGWAPVGGDCYTTYNTIFNNALAAAEDEGVILDFKGAIISLGTNDSYIGQFYPTLITNYSANMANIISWLKTITNNINLKIILYECPLRNLYTNDATIRTAQQAIADNDSNIDIFDASTLNWGTTHLESLGYIGAGLEFSDRLIQLNGGSSIIDNYYFKYQAKRQGQVDLTYTLSSSIKFNVNWGDGNEVSYTGAINHTYADNIAHTITLKTTLFPMYTAYSVNYVYGEFNSSKLDNSTVASGRSISITSSLECTSFVQPASPVEIKSINFSNTGIIGNIDLSNIQWLVNEVYITCQNNTEITGFTFYAHATTKYSSITITSNAKINSLDFSWLSPTSGSIFRVSSMPLLSTLTMFNNALVATSGTYYINSNNILDPFDATKLITNGTVTIRYDSNNWDQSEVDAIVNAIYEARSSYLGAVTFNTKGTNASPSGVFDDITDWSGGVPISPKAKIYDLLNDITGTYYFSAWTY